MPRFTTASATRSSSARSSVVNTSASDGAKMHGTALTDPSRPRKMPWKRSHNCVESSKSTDERHYMEGVKESQ